MSDRRRAAGDPSRPVVELAGATVRFGGHTVLDDVALACAPGAVVELRGSNGSGKTTVLRLLAGVRRPSVGRRRGPGAVAFVPAAVEPPAISVGTWLRAVRPRRVPVAPALAALGFTGGTDDPCRSLSHGNLRKLLLADALTARARLVVVDEAREGLDPPGIEGLGLLVRAAASRGAAVVLADQAVHPALPGAQVLVVAAGRVGPAPSGVEPEAEAEVVLRGPVAGLDALRDEARRLGFVEAAGSGPPVPPGGAAPSSVPAEVEPPMAPAAPRVRPAEPSAEPVVAEPDAPPEPDGGGSDG